ncbi:MAG: hypothetical protein KKC18_15130 [Chloroflexi bacterium]|nr:hypothetical protein [Chloroflexota bacterium]
MADGNLRARLALSDGSLIEFSEYVQQLPVGQINVATYHHLWTPLEELHNWNRDRDGTPPEGQKALLFRETRAFSVCFDTSRPIDWRFPVLVVQLSASVQW